MRQVLLPVYDLDELPQRLRQKILDKHRYINLDDSWYSFVEDDFMSRLQDLGFPNSQLSFSGFACQGDGASFVCKSLDLPRFMGRHHYPKNRIRKIRRHADRFSVRIFIERIDRRYSHEYTCHTEIDWGGLPDKHPAEHLFSQLLQHIERVRVDLCRQLHRSLESEHDYLTEDASVAQALSDSEFFVDGRTF